LDRNFGYEGKKINSDKEVMFVKLNPLDPVNKFIGPFNDERGMAYKAL
jgi:hypothetical protein